MRQYYTLLLGCLLSVQVVAQTVTLFGTVKDATSGEYLNGATVLDTLTGQGVLTNQYGFFSLPVTTHSVVRISYVGYEIQWVKPTANVQVDIRLHPQELEQVVVKDKRRLPVPIGYLPLSIKQIKSVPALLGEVDILKALSLTPGVMAGMDGSAGIYVRGGTPDQTLILLDDVPVYNVTHLVGMFSVFNPNAIQSVELYKGVFPARFGGRLAAVTELTMREGNNQQLKGEVGIGLLNQNLTLEGPIIKDKASFIVSGRVSTLGITELLKARDKKTSGESFTYNFYDLNAKINARLSAKDQLFLSFYGGNDRFAYTEWRNHNSTNSSESLTSNNWGNRTASIRYNRILSEKLFGRTTVLYSFYDSALENRYAETNTGNQEQIFRKTQASIQDIGGKFQLDYFATSYLRVKWGLDLIQHRFRPFVSKTNYTIESPAANRTMFQAFQADSYVDMDWQIAPYVHANTGVRYSSYQVQNHRYPSLEPRIGMTTKLPLGLHLKASYASMNQYMHLLTNSTGGLSFDAWLPATALAEPSNAQQFSIGLSKSWETKGVELSLEVYQKKMSRLIDYPEGTSFSDMLADSWDQIVSKNGKGRAKGVEMMVRKETGKFTGWLAYTLSKSERQFDDINKGNWFPMKFDRRHNVSVTGTLTLSQKWKLSSNFIYQTGHAVTMPEGVYFTEGNPSTVPQYAYSLRNSNRMPAYHRLDIGAIRTIKTKSSRVRTLSMGVYNAYNRANPLYVDFKSHSQGGSTYLTVKQYSLFPILPYINYSITF